MKSHLFPIIGLLALSLLAVSCKKDEPANTAPEATTAPLTLTLNAEYNGSLLAAETEYTAGADTKFRLDGLAFYVNNIELIREDGSIYTVPQTAFYVQLATEGEGGGHMHKTQHGDHNTVQLTLGDVPKGNYQGIRFRIGNNSMTGHNGPGGTEGKVQPQDFADGTALGAQSPSMWWGWGTGYIFFRLDGVVDTNDNGIIDEVGEDGATDRALRVHLGTGDLIADVTSYEHRAFSVGNGTNDLSIYFDLVSFFEDINLREEYSTHSMGDSKPLAVRFKDNLNSVFYVPALTHSAGN
ncbi:MAG: hypothetical protein KF690_03150 [Bacteroidetes bacterium]|nr:hypothetical protein [Bacteroidota bacterium]